MANLARDLFLFDGTFTPQNGTTLARVVTTPLFLRKNMTLGSTLNGNSSVLIDSQGVAWGWGSNLQGQLAINSVANVSSPTAVTGGNTWTQFMSYSTLSYFGLDSTARMWSWGANAQGQLGNGSSAGVGVTTSSPTLVIGGIRWRQMAEVPYSAGGAGLPAAVGGFGYGGIDEFGNAWMWGANNFGQLGTNVAGGATSSPVQVVGGLKWLYLTTTTASNVGGQVSGGIDNSGNGWLWGKLNGGAGGNNTATQTVSSPIQIPGGIRWLSLIPVVNIGPTIAGNTVFGFDVNNNLWSWGINPNGFLGQGLNPGTTQAVSSPVQVAGGIKWFGTPGTWTFAECGSFGGVTPSYGFFAIDVNNNLWSWGGNGGSFGVGMLGQGTTVAVSSPVQVLGGLKWAYVFSNDVTIYGITTGGDLYSWGDNTNGQIGDGTTTNRSSPVLVPGGNKWAWIITGPNNLAGLSTPQEAVIGITNGGTAWGWGFNSQGTVGDNTTVVKSSPVQVSGGKQWLGPQQTLPTVASFACTPGTAYSVVLSRLNASVAGLGLQLGPCQNIAIEYGQ